MAIDYSATKAKFPGLASGGPKVKADTTMADDDEETTEGEGGAKEALMQAQTALESALSSVKSALKAC